MIRNLEAENLVLGDEDEFHQKLEASKRLCLERIRMIPGIILKIPHYCWSLLKCYVILVKNLFLRNCIAVFVFFLSASAAIVCIIVLRGDGRIFIPMYCFTILCCSLFCLVFKKGWIAELKRRYEILENQQLIIRQEANLPTGYGANDERQPLRREEAGPTRNYSAGDAAGPSSAPQYNFFATSSSSSSDDSQDSDKPSKGPFVARLHPDAINFFGPPDKVFGADSYIVVHDPSDEV